MPCHPGFHLNLNWPVIFWILCGTAMKLLLFGCFSNCLFVIWTAKHLWCIIWTTEDNRHPTSLRFVGYSSLWMYANFSYSLLAPTCYRLCIFFSFLKYCVTRFQMLVHSIFHTRLTSVHAVFECQQLCSVKAGYIASGGGETCFGFRDYLLEIIGCLQGGCDCVSHRIHLPFNDTQFERMREHVLPGDVLCVVECGFGCI